MRESQKQKAREKTGKRIGVLLTVAVHGVLVFVFGVTGFRLIYPPPPERGILIEMTADEPRLLTVTKTGEEPTSVRPDPDKEVKLVQKSSSASVSDKNSGGKSSTVSDDGDVPKYEPKREEIDSRSLFTSADNKRDSEAEQTAAKVSEALRAGHAEGNTDSGQVTGEPSARLEGRNVNGNLPKPEYKVNKSGVVVVRIMVNREGEVTNAIPGVKGTTVTDAQLWKAAKEAAMKARFSPSEKAEFTQVGTITYVFTLK